MDFRTVLFAITEEIDSQDLAALKYLCLDCIPLRKQELIKDAMSFFNTLEEQGLLDEDNLFFLKELLYHIKRMDLLKTFLNTNELEMKHQISTKGQVSSYRILLFNLSEDVANFELKSFKFILSSKIPKYKLEDNTTSLELFIEMEKRGILGKENLDDLKRACDSIDKTLVRKIEEYESSRERRAPVEIQDVEEISDLQATFGDFTEEKAQDNTYKMNSKPRGYCLIFNNFDFQQARKERLEHQTLKDRKGTDVDAGITESEAPESRKPY